MKTWASNLIKQISEDLLDSVEGTRDYGRLIIDVDWTVVSASESHDEMGRDALVVTAESNETDGEFFDIVILDPFYPRGISGLDDFIGKRVVGVNPMTEYMRDGQYSLLCKYARIDVTPTFRANPHIGIKNQVHQRLTDDSSGFSGERVSAQRSRLQSDDSSPSGAARSRVAAARKERIVPGSEVTPRPDLTIRWPGAS